MMSVSTYEPDAMVGRFLQTDKPFHESRNFIGGVWIKVSGEARLDIVSPVTERIVATVGIAAEADVHRAVSVAAEVFPIWSRTSLAERVVVHRRVAESIARHAEDFAQLQTLQMGAPITAARAGIIGRALANLNENIESAERVEWSSSVSGPDGPTKVMRRPVGVVAAIVPWNSPLQFEVDKVSAALLAGCTVVLKPAPETPLGALLLASLFEEAGLPAGALSVLTGASATGQALVAHPKVTRVTFTGSSAAGSNIGSVCGSQFKRMSLELGGKSAAIILEDADLEDAAQVLTASNFGNAGQACHALTRVLVPSRYEDAFVGRVSEIAKQLRVGDPHDPETELGPLVAARQLERVTKMVAEALSDGVTVATGGGRPSQMPTGWYFEPTVLTGVRNDMDVAREEIFGPVLSIISYSNEEEAVDIANDSDYGLGGAVFTSDTAHGVAVAERMQTGMCAVNSWGVPRWAPFGGIKRSGVGREHGLWGITANLEWHTIRVRGDVDHGGRTATGVQVASGVGLDLGVGLAAVPL